MQPLFDPFLSFDLAVFSWIQSIQNPVLTPILSVVSLLGTKGAIFFLLGFVLLVFRKTRKLGVCVLGALAVTTVCNSVIVKELLARPRPFQLDYDWWQAVYRYPGFVEQPDSFSFPSGHTAAAFAAATAVFFKSRKGGVLLTLFAFVMGFSRVYLEVHYCTDVLFGALFGVVYALIAVAIVHRLYPIVYPVVEEKAKAIVHRIFPAKEGNDV